MCSEARTDTYQRLSSLSLITICIFLFEAENKMIEYLKYLFSFESLSWEINTNGILSLANNYFLNSSKKTKNSNKNSKLILLLIIKAPLGKMLLKPST